MKWSLRTSYKDFDCLYSIVIRFYLNFFIKLTYLCSFVIIMQVNAIKLIYFSFNKLNLLGFPVT